MDGEELKRKADEIAKAGRPAFGTIADAFRDQEVHYGSVGEELRRAREGTSTAAAALTHSLERIPDLSFLSHDPLTLEPSQVYGPEAMSLATAETNELLDTMVGHIAALVDVAKHQAELTQAIFRSNEATLAYSIKAGDEARAATTLAGKGLRLTRLAVLIAIVSSILSAIIGVAVPVSLQQTICLNFREQSLDVL